MNSREVSSSARPFKELLTIERLQKRNRSGKATGVIVIVIALIFMLIGASSVFGSINSNGGILSLFPAVMFILFPSFILCLGIKQIKKEKKENMFIDDGNFKIVEDKVYDRYMYTTHDSDGDTHYHYFVFSKIYGQITADASTYYDAKKDDTIYLLFYNNNERIERYNRAVNELDESLGESNYNSRIQGSISKLEEAKGRVRCRNCDKKYNLSKHETCPSCGSIHKFDFMDVVHEGAWYLSFLRNDDGFNF